MWTKIKGLFFPFSQIAQELKIIRELYELQLQEQKPPIMRITQRAKKTDTEVTFAGDEPRPKSALRKMYDEWNEIEGEDDT